MEASTDTTPSKTNNITKSKMVTKDERILITSQTYISSYALRNNDVIEVAMNVDANISSINNNDRLRALNYMEFVREVVPEDLSRNISIHTDIKLKFGPNSTGLTLFMPALLDVDALRSSIPIAPEKFKDDDFSSPHFVVEEKVEKRQSS